MCFERSVSVPVNSNEKLKHNIVATANRLRMIQSDFADESSEVRSGYFSEEVERILKQLPPIDRKDFLEGLMERFPVGDFSVKPVFEAYQDKSNSTVNEDLLKDPDFLVHLLLKIVPEISADKKSSIADTLRKGGLRTRIDGGELGPSIQQLKSTFQFDEDAECNPERLIELVSLVVDFVYKLEPLIGGTWRKLSPRSNIRPPRNLKNAMKQFVCDDPKTSQENVVKELKILQQLIAAIITSISRVGGEFARRHLSKLSPTEISALVQLEGGNFLVSNEVKCWRKYRELANALTEDSVEIEIKKAIADYVESFMRGMGRLR